MASNIYVFTCESERASAEKLGFKTFVGNYHFTEQFKNDICIRWGLGADLLSSPKMGSKTKEFNRVINPAKAIQLNVEKDEALKTMSKVVNTPKIYSGKVPKNKLAVYRPTSHAGGKGFQVLRGPFEIGPDCYATQYLRTNNEFRVFFCGNKTICAKRVPNKRYVKSKYVCRSMFAYEFLKKTPKQLHNMTLKAAKSIGLETGASDVLKVGNRYIFLENNSACTLDWEIITKFYKRNLISLIKKKFPKVKLPQLDIP